MDTTNDYLASRSFRYVIFHLLITGLTSILLSNGESGSKNFTQLGDTETKHLHVHILLSIPWREEASTTDFEVSRVIRSLSLFEFDKTSRVLEQQTVGSSLQLDEDMPASALAAPEEG